MNGDGSAPHIPPAVAIVGNAAAHPTLTAALTRSELRPIALRSIPAPAMLSNLAIVVLDGDRERLSGFRDVDALRQSDPGRTVPILIVFAGKMPDLRGREWDGATRLLAGDASEDEVLRSLRELLSPPAPGGASTGGDGLFETVVRETPVGLAVLQRDGGVRFVNSAFVEMAGRPAAVVEGAACGGLRTAGRASLPPLEGIGPGSEGWEGDVDFADADGDREFTASVRRLPRPGEEAAWLAVVREVTAIRALERGYSEAQRMDAVGQLAGGVAHDFNNILSVITTLSDLLIRLRPDDDPDREDLEEIFRSALRGSEITRQLSAFSRTGLGEPEVMDLEVRLRANEKMFRRLLSENITLEWDLRDDVPDVSADPVRVDQMILNLALNARDAMPEGGTLRIGSERRDLSEPLKVSGLTLSEGRYAVLTVVDTGEGMDDETRRRVFEPFFTTRGWGHRSGLGLSVVYGTVRAMGGSVRIDSRVGEGTRFEILIPAHVAEPEVLNADERLPRGTETLLLVEDHEELRKGMRRTLDGLGYRVVDAADGGEALALVGDGGLRPHLILTDVVMPIVSGSELSTGVHALGLSVPVVFFSGYTDHPEIDRLRRSGVRVLPKPLETRVLARAVRDTLDRFGH